MNAQEDSTLVDCAILCYFTLNGLRTKEVLDMLSDATGFSHVLDLEFLGMLTKRVLSLTRYYNTREGLTMEDDALPSRIVNEGYLISGTTIKPIKQWDDVLTMYYNRMGWNEDGTVPAELITDLELKPLLSRGE